MIDRLLAIFGVYRIHKSKFGINPPTMVIEGGLLPAIQKLSRKQTEDTNIRILQRENSILGNRYEAMQRANFNNEKILDDKDEQITILNREIKYLESKLESRKISGWMG